MNPSNLGELVLALKQGDPSPMPDGPEEWAEMIARIKDEGRVHEVNKETCYYFLEVLPPRWMRGSTFAFGEGADVLRLFWESAERRFFVRQLTQDEHTRFCALAQIPLSSG